jgi:polysaccharide export outer membrane protein
MIVPVYIPLYFDRSVRTILLTACLLCVTLLAGSPLALAQQGSSEPAPVVPSITETPAAPTPTAQAATSTVKTQDERYRIGPGDVLDIRVFNRPQLSRDAARVDGRGMITMPLIEGEVQAGCRTEIELASEIATRYLKYQRNPQVNVFIKEYNSQPVAVIGAVVAPGRFQLQRRVRLLELLSFAGGPAQRAGRTVQIVHTGSALKCEAEEAEAANADAFTVGEEGQSLVSYKLTDIMEGAQGSNPFVRPGDIITVPEADQVFVVGNVLRPSTIPLKESITVSQAIAMSGGTMPDTKSNRVSERLCQA